jgi:TetR/AcrR family transcriptional regulator, acrAB operon repressor
MARKTKEEALVTRCRILDAAEQVFERQGVSGTSLQDIAQAAGVTRGAIYWHFQDKADVFNGMMARVCLPMEEAATRMGVTPDPASTDPAVSTLPPLDLLRAHLMAIFARVTDDAQVRRVLEVATQKVEYVAEMGAVRERHLQQRGQHLGNLERLLRQAQAEGSVPSARPARDLALGLHALLDGLIQNWMLQPDLFDLKSVGASAVDIHLAGLGR